VILGLADTSEAPCAVLRSENPYRSFAQAVSLFREPLAPAKGVDPLSAIAADVTLGALTVRALMTAHAGLLHFIEPPTNGETAITSVDTTSRARRFPDGRESLLNNITVSANSVAGIRWFELRRRLPGNWTLRQERTYQPDSTWRWMGSIASDNQGNIALGFSASSATIHPQIRYAGRSATDPLNVLSGEQHLFNGTGSQPNDDRWGDYSDMTIDPVDDCTFYYTNEYYATTSYRDWQTRIGYFKFAQCTPPQKGSAHFVVCDRGAPLSNASVSIDGRAYGASVTDGTYDAVLPPGSHTYAVSNPAFATQTGNFSITNDQTTLVDLCPGGGGGTGLTIIQPNGGEHWLTESAQRIKWDGANLKQSDRLIIQYSRDGGATSFRIAQDIPAFTFGYWWQVDNFPTTQGRVKILLQENLSVTDQSDANFTVQRP
jgi:hypothetical protein